MPKYHHSRRSFMGLSGAGLAGLVGAQCQGGVVAAADNSPDLVVYNAKVYTVDPVEPRA
jgi:hypothetical protein